VLGGRRFNIWENYLGLTLTSTPPELGKRSAELEQLGIVLGMAL
jgi:hypothetical protein